MRFFLVFICTCILVNSSALYSKEETLSEYYAIARQQCHDLTTLRKEMDRINYAILKLLTERTAYVKRAGDLKMHTTKIAEDRQRIQQQEKIITDISITLDLPIEISLPAFRAIVDASTKFQQEYIDRHVRVDIN